MFDVATVLSIFVVDERSTTAERVSTSIDADVSVQRLRSNDANDV
jgi:hypothetical protein